MKSQMFIDKIVAQLKPVRFFDRPEFLFLLFIGFLVLSFTYRAIVQGFFLQKHSLTDILQIFTFFSVNLFIMRAIYLSLKPDSTYYLKNFKFDLKIILALFTLWLAFVIAKSYSSIGYSLRVPNLADQICLAEILKANLFSTVIAVFIFRKIRAPRSWSLLTLLCIATLMLNSLMLNIMCADVSASHRIYGHLGSIFAQVLIAVPLGLFFTKKS